MLIVDGQIHIWAANTPDRPWPPNREPHRDTPFGREELLAEMAIAGVDRCIIVPPSWEGDRNDLALESARLFPERFAVMGRLELKAPDARDQILNWRNEPGMLGMRFAFGKPATQGPLIEGRVDWVWEVAEKAEVPVMIAVNLSSLHLIENVARRYPGLKIIIDHFALVGDRKDEEAFADIDKLIQIAKYPNVAAKASGLSAYTNDSYPYRKLHPYIKRAYDAFGPRRIFWGTDFTKLSCSYRQAVTMFTEEMPWLSSGDKEWIMGRGICEWLDWPIG